MKLFTTYNRINLLVTISIFLLAGASFYYFISFIVIKQVDEDLSIEQHEIETFVKEHNRLPEPVPVRDQMIRYYPASGGNIRRSFNTAIMYDSLERERGPFRQLVFGIQVRGRWFRAFVAKSEEASNNLIRSILLITMATILLILLASVIINRIVLKRLWRPFYESLAQIKNFHLGSGNKIALAPTRIDEFVFMNQALDKMVERAQQDYATLKEFTENASHEMQTPLSVIRSKLDLLVQTVPLNEQQSQIINTSYKAVHKLTKLNQSLLLLAKIENQQYKKAARVDMTLRLEEKIDDFTELWQAEELELSMRLEPVQVEMNPELCELLLNNLLSNATRHNMRGGHIVIELTAQHLRISNSAAGAELDQKKLFQRFYKPSQNNVHNGLGLSIVKQICEASGFLVSYSFHEGLHCFEVRWQ